MKKAIIIVAVIVVVVLILYFSFGNKGNGQTFRTEKITKGNIVATVTATGTVNAVTNVQVGTQVSGRLKNIYVDFNSPVKKGQIIALVDPDMFNATVDQARANLASANANLEKAQVALIDAERTLNRNKDLLAGGIVGQSDYDTADTNYKAAKSQVNVAKAQVQQNEAALRTAETNLSYTKIISPVDGIVISRNVDVGQTVAASFQTPTLFAIAQDLTKMQIDSSVVEADIGKIKEGLSVEFTVDAYPNKTFRGRVSQVRLAPIIVQNVVTYDVVVLVANIELLLKPGMTANVSIITASRKGVLKIPNAALRFSPVGKSKAPSGAAGATGTARTSRTAGASGSFERGERGSAVWIIEANQPKQIKVTTGISDGNYTEVLSGDLQEGQELIVEDTSKVKAPTTTAPRMF